MVAKKAFPDNLEKQELAEEEAADYGVKDCMVVFGRCYSTYILSRLKQKGVLSVK